MEKLEILMISGNNLTFIPKEIGNLPLLRELVLDANQLDSVPETLADCKKLEFLSLVENPMIEKLPKVLLSKQGLRIES